MEGTRLGLTLSKNLVEAMGGALEVDSMAGEGTTFWIELRTTHAPSVGTSEADIENVVTGSITSGAKLLLVEDNLANVSLIERLLSRRTDLELIRQ